MNDEVKPRFEHNVIYFFCKNKLVTTEMMNRWSIVNLLAIAMEMLVPTISNESTKYNVQDDWPMVAEQTPT